MNVLITGSTGFIGREVAYHLRNKYQVYLLVRNSSDVSKMDLANLVILRYEQYSELADIFKEYKFDGVIHTASQVTVQHTKKQISSLFDSNILFGTHLLESAKMTNVKWFLNTGTFWQHYNNEDYNPVNLYSASKEAFENIAKFYTESSNLIFTTIKLSDTFGLNDTRDKVFNLWLKISQSGESIDMSGGDQIIDMSYIEDIVFAYVTMVENFRKDCAYQYNNKSFVVSNECKPTLRELSKMFEEVSGKKLSINWGGREYKDREVMQPYSLGSSVPNWKQTYTLKEAMKKVIFN
ncbi:NAD(P)-dependent oxidoreductase [bacterium]|nr:NAD(P)-dependent oxidoreductase [bacterium]